MLILVNIITLTLHHRSGDLEIIIADTVQQLQLHHRSGDLEKLGCNTRAGL